MRTLLIIISVFSFIVNVNSQDEEKWRKDVENITTRDTVYFEDIEGTLILTGSSSARLWKNSSRVFPDHTVLNNGFGGSQMHELLYFLEDLVLKYKPTKVLIYEGDNDISAGKTSAEIMTTTKEVVHTLKNEIPQVEIYFISPKPSLARWTLKEKYIDLNAKLKTYCELTSKVTFIDVWTPMLNEEGSPIEDIFIEDGLHMNEKGYRIWSDTVGPIVNK